MSCHVPADFKKPGWGRLIDTNKRARFPQLLACLLAGLSVVTPGGIIANENALVDRQLVDHEPVDREPVGRERVDREKVDRERVEKLSDQMGNRTDLSGSSLSIADGNSLLPLELNLLDKPLASEGIDNVYTADEKTKPLPASATHWQPGKRVNQRIIDKPERRLSKRFSSSRKKAVLTTLIDTNTDFNDGHFVKGYMLKQDDAMLWLSNGAGISHGQYLGVLDGVVVFTQGRWRLLRSNGIETEFDIGDYLSKTN